MNQTILQLQPDSLSYEEYVHLKEVCEQWENQYEIFRDVKQMQKHQENTQISYSSAFLLTILFCIWFYCLNKKQYKLTHTKYNIKPFAWAILVSLILLVILCLFN